MKTANILESVRIGSIYEMDDVKNISSRIIDPESKGIYDHWQKNAYNFLNASILYALYKLSDKSLNGLKNLFDKSDDTLSLILLHCDFLPEKISHTVKEIAGKAENEKAGIFSTLNSFLSSKMKKEDFWSSSEGF